jgi:electron transfer flavoprotein alpha subunit
VTVLVVLEHDRGVPAEATGEAITGARALASAVGEPLEAVAVGPGDGVDDIVAEAGRFGAERVHLVTHELLVDYGPDAWAESVVQLADDLDVDVVLAAGTDRGNEVLAHVAARVGSPFVANCLPPEGLEAGARWDLSRVQWGGSLLEDVTLAADRKLLTLAHHSVAAVAVDEPAAVEVSHFEPDLDPSMAATMIQGRDVETQGVTLATAPVVVSGGRGVGSADGFAALEELAELVGGVVGCSRAVTNNGWRPHTDQVGQTGTRIAPELYIAAGISGAIQHWVGAAASKKILAINTDPEANMVARADYAVIADLHEVIPALITEIRRRRDG